MSTLAEAAVIFLASAGVCLLVGRSAIRALAQAQCLAPTRYEDCPPLQAYDEAKRSVPTMGGLIVLSIGATVAAVAGGLAHRDGWLVLLAMVGLGTVGFCDDWLKVRWRNAAGLAGWPKLLAALAVGAVLGMAGAGPAAGAARSWLDRLMSLGWFWVLFSGLVVAGSAHAVNLSDGMDGLAAGCVAVAFGGLGVWSMHDAPEARVFLPWCASLAGACVGFLWFNSFPATVFLGDVGALGLGGALGAIALLSQQVLWLPLIGGVFVAEAASVMLQVSSYKWRGKRRIFRVAPLHHHFHLGGLSEPKVTVRFWIAGLILVMASLAALGAS